MTTESGHGWRPSVPDAMARLTGLPVTEVFHLERGTTLMAEARGGGKIMVIGRGLLRGVPYTVPERVGRGYVIALRGKGASLLDATTGRIEIVHQEDAIEVEERHSKRWGLADLAAAIGGTT